VDGLARIAKLLYVYFIAIEGVLDPGSRLSSVGHGDHHWRRGKAIGLPSLGCLQPVLAHEIVAVDDQIGESLVGLGLSVQVLFNPFIDVIELGSVGLGIGNSIISYDHPGGLHQAGFYGIAQAKVADDPGKEGFLAGRLAGRSKGRGCEIIAAQDAPDAVDSVQAAHPFGGLLDVLLFQAPNLGFCRDPPCMVGLVIYDQNVLGIGQIPEDIPDVSLIAPGTSFIDSLLLGDLLISFPIQSMPVPDHHFGLSEVVFEPCRNDIEQVIVVAGLGRHEDTQPVSHGKPWGHYKDVLGEPGVLWVSGLVEDLPGYEHGHDYGFA